MNVPRLFSGSRPTTGPAADAAETDRARARTSPVPPAPSATAGRSDRFELSDAARARQAEAAAHQNEVETARQALRAQPGLSDERAAEIKQRIADGFYDRPDVVAATADRLAGALRGEE